MSEQHTFNRSEDKLHHPRDNPYLDRNDYIMNIIRAVPPTLMVIYILLKCLVRALLLLFDDD